MAITGFNYKILRDYAQKSEEILKEFIKISKDKALTLCVNIVEEEGGLKNTCYLLEDGEILGKRSKLRLFKEEKEHFVEGEFKIFHSKRFGKVGILICFELRFTDLVLKLLEERVNLVLVPAQWGKERERHLYYLSLARAVELQSYLLVSDTWGSFLGKDFAGNSLIVSPFGEVLAYSQRGDCLLEASFNEDLIRKVRRFFGYLV